MVDIVLLDASDTVELWLVVVVMGVVAAILIGIWEAWVTRGEREMRRKQIEMAWRDAKDAEEKAREAEEFREGLRRDNERMRDRYRRALRRGRGGKDGE